MFTILSDEIRQLIKEVNPWIIGTEGADKNFAPIFKEKTPAEILEKNKRLTALCENERNKG